MIDNRSIDTVFLDLRLPDGSGLELLDGLKRDPVFAGLPIVILTASPYEADRVAAEALGADHFFVKPFDFENLVTLVEEVAASCWPPEPGGR